MADDYKVGDAIEDAIGSIRMGLLGGGLLSIAVHKITRDAFDQLSGEERHMTAEERDDGGEEFWSKEPFEWSNDRHRVFVKAFTNEPPVVVSLKPEAVA